MFEKMFDVIQSGNVLAFGVMFLFFLLYRARRVIEDFDWHRSRRIRLLESSLECRVLDEASRKLIKDELRTLIVARAFGQRMEQSLIEVLVRLREASHKKLRSSHLVAASEFLVLDEARSPYIKIPMSAKIEYLLNVLGMIPGMLGAIALTYLLVSVERTDPAETLKLLGGLSLFILTMFTLILDSRSYVLARFIADDVAAASSALRRGHNTLVATHSASLEPREIAKRKPCGLKRRSEMNRVRSRSCRAR